MDKQTLIVQGFTEEQADFAMKEHNKAIKDNYVPLAVHKEVRDDLAKEKATVAERDTQIAELGKNVGSVEDLQAKVTKLEADNAASAKKYQEDLATERRSNNIKAIITPEVNDVDYVLGQLDFTKIIFAEDNSIVSGFKEQYEAVKKDKPFAFKEVKPDVPPVIPKGGKLNGGKSTTGGKEEFVGENTVRALAKQRTEAVKNDKANYFGDN